MRWEPLLLLLWACSSNEPAEVDVDGVDDGLDDVATDDGISVPDEIEPLVSQTVTRHVYGTSVEGQSLVYFTIRPAQPNGKSAFLTFAMHGFEDAWKQDGRALYTIAHDAIDYYGANPARLAGWTVYIVPAVNPDGMRFGTNNLREQAGAYGRCTSLGKDINRHLSDGTSREQRELKALFIDLAPTIAIDFHGWYDTYYGNAKIGEFFRRSFNATYAGKPTKYCYVSAAGVMDCGKTLGTTFHGTTSISTDLFAEWASRVRGVPAALVEYPAPDFNNNGLYDTVFDTELGYRRMGNITLGKMSARTRVALDDLFAHY